VWERTLIAPTEEGGSEEEGKDGNNIWEKMAREADIPVSPIKADLERIFEVKKEESKKDPKEEKETMEQLGPGEGPKEVLCETFFDPDIS